MEKLRKSYGISFLGICTNPDIHTQKNFKARKRQAESRLSHPRQKQCMFGAIIPFHLDIRATVRVNGPSFTYHFQMGYGSCALAQLQQYFEGKFPNLKESAADGNEDKEDDQEDDDGEAKQVDDEVKIMCFQMLLLLAFQAHFVTFLPILVKVIFLI